MLKFLIVAGMSAALSTCGNDRSASQALAARAEAKTIHAGIADRVELPGKDLFASGSATLRPGGREAIASGIKAWPRGSTLVVQVFGDGRKPIGCGGPPHGALVLSHKRAEAISQFLKSSGGGGWSVSVTAGRGCDAVGNRAADRRVEIWRLE